MNVFLRRYRILLLVILILVVLPLILVSVYNRPILDDLSQPQAVHQAVQDGKSIFEVLSIALQGTVSSYLGWNGIFFSMFLSRIPPMVIDYRLTYIHPALFILTLAFGIIKLSLAVGNLCKVKPVVSTSIGLLLSVMFILLMPSTTEGILWFSGAINYTFMFSLSLLLYAGFIDWVNLPSRSTGHWLAMLGLCVFAFLIGGSNFTTSTVSVALAGFWIIYLIAGKRKYSPITLIPIFFLVVGYLLAVLAPGNGVRISQTEGFSLPETVYYSIIHSLSFIFGDLQFYLFLLFFLPLSLAFVHQSRCKFDHPLIVLISSFLIVMAGFFPPLQSMQYLGPPRLINIQFFIKCMFYVLNMTYLIGYAKTKFGTLHPGVANPKEQSRILTAYILIVCVLFGGSLFTESKLRPFRMNSNIASINAVATLLDGQAESFADQYDAVVQMAKDQPNEDLVVTKLPHHQLFYYLEIDPTPDGWASKNFAQYFNCKSIVYLPPK